MLTDCSSIQGSTTSSSTTLSDVMTLTTASTSSSWCAIGSGTRIRVLRLVRPHLRRLLVAPDLNPSYGFAVRGGKEFGTGFFVSNVERNTEADLKGLRVGDQILRINGFRVDDAVHKEFIQFVTSQDRITLKVRGVGMLPIKDENAERLSWHVVSTVIPSMSSNNNKNHHHHHHHTHHNSHQSSSSASVGLSSECSSYKSPTATLDSRHSIVMAGKDITIVLNVAPRTKLGLGICKGPEWKPGIFVQFTKDKSVAREAGLRQGDQILSVNSIDFSDVLFSEAVAVMKGSNKLEMLVRSGAGCDLFPGESSGYNSSASSVTGDQSPCWGDPKSKRLTSVREEPSANGGGGTNRHDDVYARPKELNKTIIKLTENGTSINNTYIEEPLTPPPNSFQKLPDVCFVGRGHPTGNGSHAAESQLNAKQVKISSTLQRQPSKLPEHNYGTLKPTSCAGRGTSAAMPAPNGPPNPPPPLSDSSRADDSHASGGGGSGAAGSSLTSAIEQELRKRKEKQQQQQQQHSSSQSINDHGITCNRLANLMVSCKDRIGNANAAAASNHTPTTSPSRCNRPTSNISDQHNALMDEFKRAHQRMFKNGFQENEQRQQQERQEALKRTTIMADDVNHRNSVMPLSNTAITTAAAKTTLNNNDKFSNGKPQQQQQIQQNNHNNIPPPPPQFANSPPKTSHFKSPNVTTTTTTTTTPRSRPPTSPTPDYDNVQMRTHTQVATKSTPSSSSQEISTSNNNRRTLRLGTVTIGEYERQRKEPTKFDFIGAPQPPPPPPSQQQQQQRNGSLESNGNGSSNNNNNHNNNNKQTLHNELQHTLTRSNLKKSNMPPHEHQSNCPNMQTQYGQRHSVNLGNGNVSTLNRLTGVNFKTPEKSTTTTTTTSTTNTMRNGGILKNGGSSSTSSSSLYSTMNVGTKNSEKTITFGN